MYILEKIVGILVVDWQKYFISNALVHSDAQKINGERRTNIVTYTSPLKM